MHGNTYWNSNGRFQKEYEELEVAEGFKWTKSEENAKHRYYRYFNDGDLPQGTCFASKEEIQSYLEAQANIAIAKGYCRAHKGEKIPVVIRAYASRPLQGFKAWAQIK
ncbi:MAG: hypothetical protein ACI4MN_05835 [Candidatus Coproplasma sp.]